MRQWFVEPSVEAPIVLVEVDDYRKAKLMTPAQPVWAQRDSMARWAFDSTGINVSREQAAKIAASWGTKL
jgi:hypothetical protein